MSRAMHWLEQGGPATFLLLTLSVAVLSIIIVKIWEFIELRINRRGFVAVALDAWQRGDAADALQALKGERNPLARVMASAIQLCAASILSAAERRELATQFAAERLESLRLLLRPLEAIARLAPLLGLFGTVLGMLDVFQQWQAAGSEVTAGSSIWSGGIAEALLSAASSLLVAIVAGVALQIFDRIVERLHRDMESALTRIFVPPPMAWNGSAMAAAAATADVSG
jgi:biopolymer transport protein ExbB